MTIADDRRRPRISGAVRRHAGSRLDGERADRHRARRAPRRAPPSPPRAVARPRRPCAGRSSCSGARGWPSACECRRSAQANWSTGSRSAPPISRCVNRQLETEVAERRADRAAIAADPVRSHPGGQARRHSARCRRRCRTNSTSRSPPVKTYADNAAMLIDRERVDEARDNVSRISGLVDRMASISRHLRNFARKPNQKLGAGGAG